MRFKNPHARVLDKINPCFQNGIYKPAEDYDDEGTKIVRIDDYTNDGVKKFNNLKSVNLKKTEIDRFSLKRNDILINRVNSLSHVGKSCVIDKIDFPMVFESNMMRLRLPEGSEVLPEYLFIVLNSSRSRDYLRKVAKPAVAQASINQEDIKSLALFLPSLEQQTAIATLISTWDQAIEKTERLIAAKEKRFSWLLNRMINEESIQGEWKRLKLGEIVEINKGQQLNVSDMVDSGRYYALNGGIEPSGFTNHWNTNENTITISEGGNSCGFVNFNTEKFWCGGHCYALNNLKNRVVDNRYLYNFLKYHEKSLMLLRVGSGLPNIQKKDIQSFSVTFPPISQQKQIATILDTARHEIDLVRKKTDGFRRQKRGLMQKLLTG